jgi:hypothetical protein
MRPSELASAIEALHQSMRHLPPPTPNNPTDATLSPATSPQRKKRRPGIYTYRSTHHPPNLPPVPVQHFPLQLDHSVKPSPNGPAGMAALQAALQQPIFPSTAVQLVLDKGASVSVSPEKGDFIGPVRQVQPTTLQGIASGLSVEGTGTVHYSCQDDNGKPIKITIANVLYVPSCPARLICPRQLLAAFPHPATCNITTTSISIQTGSSTITVPYETVSQLPILWTSTQSQAYLIFCDAHKPTHTIESSTTLGNLTPAQTIKLKWHNRLNHVGFDQLTRWMRDGTITAPPAVINCPHPVCTACLFGKAKRRPHKHHTGSITQHCTRPGDGISADQLEAGTPGIVATTKGLPTSMTYKYCNFWLDHHSKFIFVTMHPTKEGKEMLRSKQVFEAFCRQHEVNIRSIRADNGIYSSAAFRDSCSAGAQQLTYCGVGSHWQNGLAERAIGSIQATARTILLHAMSKWPSIITEAFWPFAITHAVHLYNISSKQGSHQSPWESFTGTPPSKHPSDSRVFGCPAFVLNKVNQDNPSAAKTWASRCWQGVYVGFSPMHASTVALIFNPSTKHVTPQFHVSYDEDFSTVAFTDPSALESRLETLVNSKSTWKFVNSHGDDSPCHNF